VRVKLVLLAGVATAFAFPAWAQTAPAEEVVDDNEIIVTAQRSDQRLQDVPIAVSAFNAEALDKQQIKNTSDLQLTLPNVTFTKGNFTGSSFTIRGIGDLCVGVSCDSATAIHMNDAPLFATRLFESEFYDLAQIEVLRGPQGTLFGRNATSGVVNIRSARPKLGDFEMSAEGEYGNYNGVKFKGMVNAPIGENVAVRLAGFYLNREGYTTNLFDNSKIDDRNMYGLRGSIRFEPSESTSIDLMAQYFHERDNRMRIQKQLCQRDPTGVLGCLAGSRDYGLTNANSTFTGVLTSREFLTVNGIPSAFGLGSLYGPDAYAGVINPADPRVVNTDYTPTYFADEWIAQARIEQDLGSGLSLKLNGNYQRVRVDSQQDYNNSVQNRAGFAGGLGTLQAAAAGLVPGLPASYFAPLAAAVIPNGAAGVLCTSLSETTGTGSFRGNRLCSQTPQDFDRSVQETESWTTEAIVSSDFDGPFNFLIGGIYGKLKLSENSYYVNSFSIDYLTGLLGSFNALGRAGLAAIPGAVPPPPGYLGTPYFRNNTNDLRVTTYGLFGEAYYDLSDKAKLTVGLRYNNDKKDISARSTLASFLVPYGATDAFSSPFVYGYAVTGAPATSRLAPFDADPTTPCSIVTTTTSGTLTPANLSGCELFSVKNANFSEFTGRAVFNYEFSPDNMMYVSYSRGYKSGGINPPLQPIFTVPTTFKPEFVNAFEVGSKNTFGNVQLNLTGFYYQYKDLQLSRIVARTSVNDNVSANIWGLEAEAIFRPTRELTINMNASYLNTKVSEDKLLANPRDFGAGRADAVIIKDITNGANCAVTSNTANNAAGANAFVNAINGGLGLQPTTAFPAGGGIASTGAFGICAALTAQAAAIGAGFGGITVHSSGIPVNIKGNKLPGAPDTKFSAGMQYAFPFGDITFTPRADFIYTGKSTGNIFNGTINEIDSFTQVNAQMQFDGPDRKWFARLWVQNLFDKDSITGLYVTDQSSGNFTNIFTLEPRRFGVTAGVKF
jgi:iron complex outermembrane receptor protein